MPKNAHDHYQLALAAIRAARTMRKNLVETFRNGCAAMGEYAPEYGERPKTETVLHDIGQKWVLHVGAQTQQLREDYEQAHPHLATEYRRMILGEGLEAHPHRAEQIMRNQLDGRVR